VEEIEDFGPRNAGEEILIAAGEPDDGTVGGKYKTREEATKAHHLLVHSMNALKAENDRLRAAVAGTTPAAAAPAPVAPLSPGRVDPTTATRASDPSDEKWKDQYGIDPADLDARIEARARALREEEEAPKRAMQTADDYMVKQYPDFPMKMQDISIFVRANPVLDERVGRLWAQGLYAEAMEIGYLAYDNALRAVNLTTELNKQTTGVIDGQRADGSMITSQAGGSRDPVRPANAYPQTPEDWERIREMRRAGRDEEVRAILYGPLIRNIPDLNGSRRR